MARRFRSRVTAIVLSGLVFGAPLLADRTAGAHQRDKGPGRQVAFEGGRLLSFTCRSQPEIESLTVPADTTIRLVNHTGYRARLRLAGRTEGTLADDEATEVVFRRGTTEVLLRPNCPLGDDALPLLVTASPTPGADTPDPTSEPGDDDTTAPASPDSPDSVAPDVPLVSPTKRPKPHHPRPSASASSRSAAVRTKRASHHAPHQKPKIKSTPSRTPGAPPSSHAGTPPVDDRALFPGVPGIDLSSTEPQAEPAAPGSPSTQVAAAEPVATVGSMTGNGRIGLLALTAAVLALGVGTAAIRAIVSQRANRANIA